MSGLPTSPAAIDRGVARAVLLDAVPASADDPARADAVARFAADRIRGCPAPMRAGVRLVGVALAVLVLAVRRVRVDVAPPAVVGRAVGPWLRLPLPGLAEYARLVRSLVVVGWFDGVGAGAGVAGPVAERPA